MLLEHIKSCFSCGKILLEERTHTETYRIDSVEELMPLCDTCLEFPHRMNMSRILERVFSLVTPDRVRQDLLEALIKNRTDRYQNPTPVIVALIFTKLHDTGGTVLVARRSEKMKEYPGELALVSGYMEQKHCGWRGSLKAEASEEVNAVIDTDDKTAVYQFSYDSAANSRLVLLYAVVMPQAVRLEEFVPDDETSERIEFDFDRDTRPVFGIPAHNEVFDRFCRTFFA